MSQICPFCLRPIEENSKDHIFPQFLGGSRKINACKECNNTFGHTFEGKASVALQALHVFISSWGLPLRSVDPIWKGAHTEDGKVYDLAIGPTAVTPLLGKPVIEYDENGDIIAGQYRTEKQAKQAAESLLKKGKAKEVRIEQLPPATPSLEGLGIVITLGPDLRRTVLKMCMGAATLLPDYDHQETGVARKYLNNVELPMENNIPAYDQYPQIDERRKPLSHVIYVERGERYVSGFVQLFGVIQLYCHLGDSSKDGARTALIATLDPVNGDETFTETPLLNLEVPPYNILLHEYPRLMGGWLAKFGTEAAARGATHPPDLKMGELTIS
jgi:hypothetical protein